ncbi:hypothetical protein [Sedimenticola thiotaurini]|uniref:Uncharacterized protein n=1 Tax=Sedimenticola thiotaurini TaxID=1543721 RepID=A0A0F7JWC0_9GAMM|nr:hypothetical protein [Sedimenticola thiotaurini]AKH20786.1 hypothetical protein AAY24_11000 [Sedimenticola thiotaurini]
MTTTITSTFTSMETIRNTMEDLLANGIEREKMFADDAHTELKIMIPDDIQNEVIEIIQRHKPIETVSYHR